MTYYELFQQGPMVYIPVLLISLVVTLLAYAALPIILAKTRKKIIAKKKYNLLCYGINFLIMIVFIGLNGKSSGAPYIIWTGVFSSMGLRILKKRNVLDGFQTVTVEQNLQAIDVSDDAPRIRFCRKCGSELLDGAKFCNKCGTKVI
jgi:hypothetical protein